jgi:hypothetical protein
MGDAPEGVRMKIPDYYHDLNAVAGAEKQLKDTKTCQEYSQVRHYLNVLEILATGPTEFATAQQRSGALVKVIGKWRDQ